MRVTRAALIDLDGTLLDTAPELAAAANAMLDELGLAPLPGGTVSSFIGQGVQVLVLRCLAACGREPAGTELEIFSRHYERLSGSAAQAYPGVHEGLAAMREGGLALACVTNKPARFTLPLLAAAGLARYFDAVVTADAVGRRKPHPEPFLHACRLLGVSPGEAVVIGDSANDAGAAHAAGCRFLLVPYGYREGRDARDIASDGIVASLHEAAMRIARRH
ncbi:MAG: phosphoglycolate phosphatase [Burkholderiales bacterium]